MKYIYKEALHILYSSHAAVLKIGEMRKSNLIKHYQH